MFISNLPPIAGPQFPVSSLHELTNIPFLAVPEDPSAVATIIPFHIFTAGTGIFKDSEYIFALIIIFMEMSIKTMMIIVLGVITLLILVTIFSYVQGEGKGLLDGIFDWFRILGGGS